MNVPPPFARDDPTIPVRLRNRIEHWGIQPPRSQFQQYGPLNAFLSIKFPPESFLVKPQALLRATFPGMSAEDAVAVRADDLDETMDGGGADEVWMQVDEGRVSLDSNNAFVVNECKTYPDFVITAYGDVARPHEENDGDVIRLIIEVGSIKGRRSEKKAKEDIQGQLYKYMELTGERGYRWEGDLIGIAIIGTQFSILKSTKEGFHKTSRKWHSLYSELFTDTIDRVLKNMKV